MANINDILNEARIKGCSDVHIGENTGITLRQDGKLIEFEQTFSNIFSARGLISGQSFIFGP